MVRGEVEEPRASGFEANIKRVSRGLKRVGLELNIASKGCHPGCGIKCGSEVGTRNASKIIGGEEVEDEDEGKKEEMPELDIHLAVRVSRK